MNTEEKLKDLIASHQDQLGFSNSGWTSLTRPFSIDIYRQWIREGRQGEMTYLETHLPIKENPQSQWPQMKSAIVFTAPYFPQPQPRESKLHEARISLYAQGYDYHLWFRQKLNEMVSLLQAAFPEEHFLSFVDTAPILERDLAHRAGLGWTGKNSCLIHNKHGSLFFIGEILSSLDFKASFEPLPDFCGKCRRCIDACPTQAIEDNRTLDARKCIAYWTIESRQVAPEPLRSQFGDHFFGCDICQTVCPWNQKIFKGLLEISPQKNLNPEAKDQLTDEMNYILLASGKQLERDFKGTALSRAGQFGLKRNALYVVANQKLHRCKDAVTSLSTHEKLGELAHWCLDQLKT